MEKWNNAQWLQDFDVAKRNRDTHGVRKIVFESTLRICKDRVYESQSGKIVHLSLSDTIEQDTRFYVKEIPQITPQYSHNTQYYVHNGDCLEYAKGLVDRFGNDSVCVLNLASRRNPGGGVLGGAGAQEEYLFRCSDYFRSLYQYADFAYQYSQYGIHQHPQYRYPMDQNFGGSFSKGITIFRDNEEKGYALIDDPWRVNMVAVAGINHPALTRDGHLINQMSEGNRNKIRTILRIAYLNGQKHLVLGALGCGAFGNPPQDIANLFKEELFGKEFNGAFESVHFAIKVDHNDPRNVNYNTFKETFIN